MHDLVKALAIGAAAVFASEYAETKLSSSTDTDSTKTLYKYGGAAAGAFLAMHFLPKLS